MISRGTLQLDGYPTVDDKTPVDPFAQIMIRETGTLSFGEDVNDFTKFFDLQVDDDARLRIVLRDSDVAGSRAEAMGKKAILEVRTIDATWLGSGPDNKDRRLAIQLDLKGKALKKGQWIKVFEAEDAVK